MSIGKENLNNFLPNGFETENKEDYKMPFDEDLVQTGYERDVPDIVSGPNLNNLIDVVGKNTNTLNKYVNYLNEMPINSIPITDSNNNLNYVNNNFLNKTQITNCILEAPNGVATYSGSTITIKAGLKVLIPNGRNADGSLNNIEVTLDVDVTETNTDTYNDYSTYLAYENNQFSCLTTSTLYYDEETNYYKNSNTQEIRYVVKITQATSRNNGTVTSFNPLQSVNLLKRSDKSEISGWGMPSSKYINLTLGADGSEYIAPANGWFYIAKNSGGSNKFLNIYNNKRVSKGTSLVGMTQYSVGLHIMAVYVPAIKGDNVEIRYNATGKTEIFRFVYAEGEI